METMQRPTIKLNAPTSAPISFGQFGNPLPFSPAEMTFLRQPITPLLGGGGGGRDDREHYLSPFLQNGLGGYGTDLFTMDWFLGEGIGPHLLSDF